MSDNDAFEFRVTTPFKRQVDKFLKQLMDQKRLYEAQVEAISTNIVAVKAYVAQHEAALAETKRIADEKAAAQTAAQAEAQAVLDKEEKEAFKEAFESQEWKPTPAPDRS